MIFICNETEQRNANGRLAYSGVLWSESCTGFESALINIGMALLAMSLASCGATGYLFTIRSGAILFALSAAVILAIIGWQFIAWAERVKGKFREITFGTDGATYAVRGLSTVNFDQPRFRTPHSQIEAIEVEQLIFPKGDDKSLHTHGVRIFYGNGTIVPVAEKLERDQAHMLTVKLRTALNTIRSEIGTVGNGLTPHRSAARRPVRELIG